MHSSMVVRRAAVFAAALAAFFGADRAQAAPTWKSTVFELDVYGDVSSGAVTLQHQSGIYPVATSTTAGPAAGQFFVATPAVAAGLPVFSFVQDFVKIRQNASVTYTFYPGTILPVRSNAIYLLYAGDQIPTDLNGKLIADIRIDFTDGAHLDASNLSALKLVAGFNIRNDLAQIGAQAAVTTLGTGNVDNIYHGSSANQSNVQAFVDLLKIALPTNLNGVDFTLKKLSSITFNSRQDVFTNQGGLSFRPGLNLYGLTALAFRAQPHGWFFENGSETVAHLSAASGASVPADNLETNFYSLFAADFANVSSTIVRNARGGVNFTDQSMRAWARLMGVLSTDGTILHDASSGGGCCFGLASTSIDLYNSQGALAQNTQSLTPNHQNAPDPSTLLPGGGNTNVATYNFILRHFYRQFNGLVQQNTRFQRLFLGPNDVLDLMLQDMLTNHPFVIDFFGPWGGHSVAPECIIQDPVNAQIFHVFVYDNNTPDQTNPENFNDTSESRQFIFFRDVDPTQPPPPARQFPGHGSFTYEMGGSIGTTGTLFDGGAITTASTDDIDGGTELAEAFFPEQAGEFLTTTLSPDGSFGFVSSAGLREGFVNGAPQDEVPGAIQNGVAGVINGNPSALRMYRFPVDAYTVTYTASAPGVFDFSAVLPLAEVRFGGTSLGEAYAISISRDAHAVTLTTTVTSSAVSLELAFFAPTGSATAPFFFTIAPLTVGSSGPISVTVDVIARTLAVVNLGAESRTVTATFTQGDGATPGVSAPLGTFTVAASSSMLLQGTGGGAGGGGAGGGGGGAVGGIPPGTLGGGSGCAFGGGADPSGTLIELALLGMLIAVRIALRQRVLGSRSRF